MGFRREAGTFAHPGTSTQARREDERQSDFARVPRRQAPQPRVGEGEGGHVRASQLPAGRAPSPEPVGLARRPARARDCECTTGGPEQQRERQVGTARGVPSPLRAARGPKGRPALEPQGLRHLCSPSIGPRAPWALHASPPPYPGAGSSCAPLTVESGLCRGLVGRARPRAVGLGGLRGARSLGPGEADQRL